MKTYEKPEIKVMGDAASVIQGGGIHKEPNGLPNGPFVGD
jgi:hypothetical protein